MDLEFLFIHKHITFVALLPLATTQENVAEWVLFLGRFHPLILHLPIGGLLLVFYLDIIGRIRKNYQDTLIKKGLGFTAFFAIIACILGYFLSLEGGYEEKITNTHMWTGVATAVLITIVFLLKQYERKPLKKLFFPLFVTSIILISVTGHYGSILTHGDDFLTQYATLKTKDRKPQTMDSLQYFSDVIYPILDTKCIQCHNKSKRKGELAMISEEALLKGGAGGAALQPGDAMNSIMIKRILLPLEDEEHMPPTGKSQLTSDEIWLLKHWIDNGADFKEKAIVHQENDTLMKLLQNYIQKDIEKVPEASIAALNDILKAGFLVTRIAADQPFLSAKFTGNQISKEAINVLKGIADQLVALDVNNTPLTDEMTKGLKYLKKLETLRLNNTKISDKTIGYLVALEKLNVLNVHHTAITNKSLSVIVEKITPEDVYVWNTKADKQYIQQLTGKTRTIIHHGTFEGFTEMMPLKMPKLMTKQTIFADRLNIVFDEPVRNATIRYTIDGTEPDSTSTVYTEPITITDFTKLKAKMYKKEWLPSPVMETEFFKIKHTVKDFDIVHHPAEKYPDANKIYDLKEGSLAFADGNWTGYEGENLITTINFNSPKPIENISVSCLQDSGSWILFPRKIEVFIRNENTAFK
ncbi:MAG: chitobiase/beta-hexosaminidase C-terminal domain-containing protein, partial [Bacteroidota bacterium]